MSGSGPWPNIAADRTRQLELLKYPYWPHFSGRFGLRFLSNFAQVAFSRTAVETEKSCDFFHSVILVSAEFVPRTQDLMDYLVPLLSTFEIGGSIAGIASSAAFWSISRMLNCSRTSFLNSATGMSP